VKFFSLRDRRNRLFFTIHLVKPLPPPPYLRKEKRRKREELAIMQRQTLPRMQDPEGSCERYVRASLPYQGLHG